MNKKSSITRRKVPIKQTPEKIIKDIVKTHCANYVSGTCVFNGECKLLKKQYEECRYFVKNILLILSEDQKKIFEEYERRKEKSNDSI